MELIRRDAEGKVVCWLESTAGYPALAMAQRKLGAGQLRTAPAELIDALPLAHDAVVVFRLDGGQAETIARALDMPLPAVTPSGYRLETRALRGATVLVVVGGDLFGMLAGFADLCLHAEMAADGLYYRGGTRTETPAFPLRFYWTWDHSTNWVLDDPGNQVTGCQNRYLKRPETYVEDYRRLVDHCVEMRCNGLIIWGFLRHAHGGERDAYAVAQYAADHGVAILPGAGTTGYGGIYYEGAHPANLETYLAQHPERGNMGEDGQRSAREMSPYSPENQAWIARSLAWLYRTFPIGGVNLENNDLMVDHSPRGRAERATIDSGEADYFTDQYFAYRTALEVADRLAPQAWNTYATYSGFGRGRDVANAGADMGVAPYFATRMPASALAQWTLTGMLSPTPAPLRAWRESARPAVLYDNPRWPRGLRPPTPRSTGFIHQASQWSGLRRCDVAISTFAEACLRGWEAGLEGIGGHGEVTSRSLAWQLNYLTQRHWTYHPESTLDAFARAELAPRLGGADDAGAFIECLCLLEDGKYADVYHATGPYIDTAYPRNAPDRGHGPICRLWEELREWAHLSAHPGRSIARGHSEIV